MKKEDLVIGQQYRTLPSSWMKAGSILTYIEDDGTESPRFACTADVNYTCDAFEHPSHLEPLEPEEPKELPAVHISLNPNSTTIVIQKRLSLDEVRAVMAAAGV